MKFTSTIAILGLSASALARGHTKRSGSNGNEAQVNTVMDSTD